MHSQKKHVFIITSVILPTQRPLSYTSVRSVYSANERVIQTNKTIESIRKHFKESSIVLIEMGLNESLLLELETTVDKLIFVGNNKIVRWACDGRYKGLGEAIGLLAAVKQINNLGDYYFKISGRYFLTDDFNHGLWNSDNFVVRKYNKDISTRLYGFPKELFSTWQFALLKSIPLLLAGVQIEHVLPKFLPTNRIRIVDKLGVAGAVAPNGIYLDE